METLIEQRLAGNRLVVKYSDEVGYEKIISGVLRLGSHQRYSQSEGAEGDLMKDTGEGELRVNVPHTMGEKFQIGNIHCEGNYIYGSEPGAIGLSAKLAVDTFLFCVSIGPYCSDHHQKMMFGSANYKGTENYTRFVVFDVVLLCEAIADAAERRFGSCDLLVAPCVYQGREVHKSGFELQNEMSMDFQAIFRKPLKYEVENELRIALILKDPEAYRENYLDLEIGNIGSIIRQ